ncbi:acetyltransferase [Thozetella sp. PMI_491]|nr:acetyltransferase [Thozetella sp. PMI_491]
MSGPTYRPHHKIVTPRLIIRTAVPKDAQAIAELRRNPKNDLFEHVDSGDVEDYLRRIEKWTKAAEEGKFSFTVILLKNGEAEGELIGFGGYNEFRWLDVDGQAEKVLEVDVGAQIENTHWRKGYGREAFAGMAEYAFTELGAQRLACDTNPKNEAWKQTMNSVGFGNKEKLHVNAKDHPLAGKQSLLWEITREDWEAAKADMKKSGRWPL